MSIDRKVLLHVADGPEAITIYTSENGAVVDWCADCPALYLEASTNDAQVKLGPFHLSSIRRYFEEKAK